QRRIPTITFTASPPEAPSRLRVELDGRRLARVHVATCGSLARMLPRLSRPVHLRAPLAAPAWPGPRSTRPAPLHTRGSSLCAAPMAPPLTALGNHVLHIVLLGSDEQVGRSDTAPIVATMAN